MSVHFAIVPFVAVCGADEPNQHTTSAPEFVSCPECAAKLAADQRRPYRAHHPDCTCEGAGGDR